MVLAAIVIVVMALYFAKSILVPLALAVLLSFLLAPPVTWIERRGLGRVGSVLIVVGLSFAVLTGIGWTVWWQLSDLAIKLPEYRGNIQAKAESLRGTTGGMFSKTTGALKEVAKDLAPSTAPVQQEAAETPHFGADGHVTRRPVPVELVERPTAPLEMLQNTVGALVEPLATAGLVIIFVIFMLVWREDMRDRLIRLLSPDQENLNITTQALDDAARRMSRYLLMQLIVNLGYGLPIAIGLFFIGVPNAFLWGLMAAILRFIPYVGPWLGAVGPIVLSLAVSLSWWTPVLTVALYLVVELITYNVAEPLVYGASTGISSVAVLVAAVFWGWLWGIPGLLLATPLTVCLAVMGKYVPQMRFLSVLLGDEPVLSPPMRIYQRLLAGDPEEAADVVEEHMQKRGLVEVYDETLIPALRLAEEDRHRGVLDERRQKQVQEGMKEIVEELGERFKVPTTTLVDTPGNDGEARPNEDLAALDVLCLPASDEGDEVAAEMLAQGLALAGCRAKYVPVAALASEMVETAIRHEAKIVCISAVPPAAMAHSRYLCKRLMARLTGATLVTGLWGMRGDLARSKERLGCGTSGQVVRTLGEAVALVTPLVQSLTAAKSAQDARTASGPEPTGGPFPASTAVPPAA